MAKKYDINIEVLVQAQSYYMQMDRYRKERERCKSYTYGDQWGDMVCVDGCMMREDEYIMRQGSLPLKNNMIRRLVNSVVGVWHQQDSEPVCVARDRDEQSLGQTMSVVLQYNGQLNRLKDLYGKAMEEFLISGLVVHRKSYGYRRGRMDCWTDVVDPNSFFIDNRMRDVRGWDCQLIGQIHDLSLEDLLAEFAGSAAEEKALREIYAPNGSGYGDVVAGWREFGYHGDISMDFLTADQNRCRVIEVWRKETKPRYHCIDMQTGAVYKVETGDYQEMVVAENARRRFQGASNGEAPLLIEATWAMDTYWQYYFLSPWGHVIRTGETPYWHGEHPYVFKAYPFLSGEIHSFVSDVIDQQRYTNRLITLYDLIMRSSAKGVLMVPEDCIPKHMSPDQFAEAWTRFNGVIVYRPSASGVMPTQIAANSTNIGITELLSLQLKFFEEISGVNGALQGKQEYAGISAAMYNQQTQNATTSLLGLLDAFSEFVREAAYKDCKNIQQYYDDERVRNIAGNNAIANVDPEMVHDIEYDISIAESKSTPAYRAAANQFLMQIWQSGQIGLKDMLQVGAFPFGDELIGILQAREQEQAQQMTQQMGGNQAQQMAGNQGQMALPTGEAMGGG